MKRAEEVYREILYYYTELKRRSLTQSYLAKKLGLSLSVVNNALRPLRTMLAIEIKSRGFAIVDARKILFYWASVRDLQRDIIYSTRVEKPVHQIESEMPTHTIYGAYSAYKFMFGDVPADYSEVYVYADELETKERFPENRQTPNLFILKKDGNAKMMTKAWLFVDLWNLREWYAKEFLKALEKRINGLLE